MKTSLRKLRGFALRAGGGDYKDRRDLRPLAQFDELAKASQDMQAMRDCYDSLLSAAAATANSAYEFSESLGEMGACLLEKTTLNDDEESGKVLLMIGKVQYELQKLVDGYRSHIFQTIAVPSESLLNELRTVEEMKQQCDEKRDTYEYMVMQHREKGRGRSSKGNHFSMQQLQAAHDQYDEEATLLVFRLKSLKQGQSRSLLTQAARHHAAQLCFFKKALKSLEAVEPHVKKVTEQQHIDYHFSGLDNDYVVDDGDNGDDDDGDNGDDDDGDGELSFDYGQNDQEEKLTSRNMMDLDLADLTFPRVPALGRAQEGIDTSYRKSFSFRRDIRKISQSAPLLPENKFDQADKLRQIQPSFTRKLNTYVLPTPDDTKSSKSTESSNPGLPNQNSSLSGHGLNLWHSTTIDPMTHEKLPESTQLKIHLVQREINNNTPSSRLPPPLDGILFSQPDLFTASDSKKLKRHAFSGPITPKPWPTRSVPVEHPQLFSGPILPNPMAQSPPKASLKVCQKVSPKVSPSASPTFLSSPKISELHELPRPPASSSYKSLRPISLVGHSAPLARNGHILPASIKPLISSPASPLPTPSQVVTRSFSIPSSGLRAMALNVCKPPEANDKPEMIENVTSPPLTPISLSNVQPPSAGSETENQAAKIRGAD